ncbi:MAG: MerR family transcriptional regulator [Acidimicrobiaceae bacterium]|nr:MerR family transcriptional regulator [Acidimicrobiaceae bacterium]
MIAPSTPLKIGQVHALLRREYPNLELSKIRYYEEMGLVAPARSRKGYRLYSEKDVSCLREAIRLADKEFVPLRVIRVRLMEQGLLKDELHPSAAPRQAARSALSKVVSLPVPATTGLSLVSSRGERTNESDVQNAVESEEADASAPDRLSTNQLLEESRVEPELLNKILSLGLLSPARHGTTTSFDDLDVAIVQAAARLLRSGADARLLGALRRVVEREVGIIDDLTADLRGSSSTPSEVIAVQRSVAHEVEVLRAGLFERALNDFLHL